MGIHNFTQYHTQPNNNNYYYYNTMKINTLPVAISAISASTVSACDTTGAAVSVCRDATYRLNVPETQLCSGPTNMDPHGTVCPMKGDVASADCHKYLTSYDQYEHKCIAPENAKCMALQTGAYGCVFPSVGCDGIDPKTTTQKPTTTTTTPVPGCYTTHKPTTTTTTTKKPTTTTTTTKKPTTTPEPEKCYRPLNYQGCNQGSIKCGTFAGFQLQCNTDGNPGGQCRCDPSDAGCNDAVMYHNVSSVPGYLPQFGTNCNKAKGCMGYGQLCNQATGDCKNCAEDVKCVANKDDFYQCHTCSSCLEQHGYFDCTSVCGLQH